jgi:hypothetical protein
MAVVEAAKKRVAWRAVTRNAALSVQRKFEMGRHVSQKSQSALT